VESLGNGAASARSWDRPAAAEGVRFEERLTEVVSQATIHAGTRAEGACRSSKRRADSGRPGWRGQCLERTLPAEPPLGGLRRRLALPGRTWGRPSRSAKWLDPHGGTRLQRPLAGDTRFCTAAGRSAQLPVSAQSKGQLLEPCDARLRTTARRTPTTWREQVSIARAFSHFQSAAGPGLRGFLHQVPKIPQACSLPTHGDHDGKARCPLGRSHRGAAP
jgi:hypothetical protein